MGVAKARRFLLEGVRDHVVLNIFGKDIPISMWNTLTKLFKNNRPYKIRLKEKN